jgi:hypothetical protein
MFERRRHAKRLYNAPGEFEHPGVLHESEDRIGNQFPEQQRIRALPEIKDFRQLMERGLPLSFVQKEVQVPELSPRKLGKF